MLGIIQGRDVPSVTNIAVGFLRDRCKIPPDELRVIPLTDSRRFTTKKDLRPKIKHLREELKREIAGCTQLIGLGLTATRVMAGINADVGAERGLWRVYEGLPTLLTFSPMVHDFWKSAWDICKLDLGNAADVYKTGSTILKPKFHRLDTPKTAIDFLTSISGQDQPVVFDIETTGLNPYRRTARGDFDHRIITLAFSLSENEAFFIPLDHKDSPLKDNGPLRSALITLFESRTPLIAHNAKFEFQWVARCLGVEIRNFHFDTQIAGYLLNENHYGNNGLKSLARDYTVFGGYEQGTLKDKQALTFEDYSLDELFEYNSFDVICTFILFKRFKKMLEDQGLLPLLMDQYLPAVKTFGRMEATGQEIHRQRFSRAYDFYTGKMAELEEKILSHDASQRTAAMAEKWKIGNDTFTAQQWIEIAGGSDLEEEIGVTSEKREKLREELSLDRRIRDKLKRAEKKNPGDADLANDLKLILDSIEESSKALKETTSEIRFLTTLRDRIAQFEKSPPKMNIRSNVHLQILLYDVLKLRLPVWAKKTKKGAKPTDASILKHFQDDSDLVNQILEHKQLDKPAQDIAAYLNKYSDTIDTRVHPSYRLAYTATGRTSSRNPNAQNQTSEQRLAEKGYPGIKRCTISRFKNGVIIQADYSQLELRILAMYSRDPNLVQVFRDGHDLHTATAALIFDKPIDEVSKLERKVGKTINFGIIYEVSAMRIAHDLGCTVKEAEGYQAMYFEKFSKVRMYTKQAHREAMKNGFVVSQSGRRRRFPEIAKYRKNPSTDF